LLFNGIVPGQYVPADSVLHKLDPRSKIFVTVLAMAAIFMSSSFPALIAWCVMLPFVIFISKLPVYAVLRSAKPILVLIIFTSFLHLFWTGGSTVLLKIGPLAATGEGAVAALRVGLRLYLLVLYAGLLTLTTSPSELSDGLECMMKPFAAFGFPAHEIAMMMTIALRFIPTFFEETERIMNAQLSRGANFDTGGIAARAKAYIPVLIPLFVLVFKRADTLASAMESRCYRGGKGRVRMYPLKWGYNENVFFVIFILFVIVLFTLDKIGW